jgi:hypothetical protein
MGGYFPSNDKDIKIFHCRICSGLTSTDTKKYEFDLMEHDVNLRGEAIRLQIQYYKHGSKKQLDKTI